MELNKLIFLASLTKIRASTTGIMAKNSHEEFVKTHRE
jgi:hypothetical protein